MEKVQIDLRKRSPELALAKDFFYQRFNACRTSFAPRKESLRNIEDYISIDRFCDLDLLLEIARFTGNPASLYTQTLFTSLDELETIARRHKILRTSLRDYLPRLKMLTQGDDNLREFYAAYEKKFGGEK